MNFNNYTIKSQEAVQQAQQLAQSFEHQQIENEHLFKAIFEVDENVLPFILKKLNVNVTLLQQILDKELERFSKVSGGDVMLSREAGKSLNEASIVAKKMNDDFVSILFQLRIECLAEFFSRIGRIECIERFDLAADDLGHLASGVLLARGGCRSGRRLSFQVQRAYTGSAG